MAEKSELEAVAEALRELAERWPEDDHGWSSAQEIIVKAEAALAVSSQPVSGGPALVEMVRKMLIMDFAGFPGQYYIGTAERIVVALSRVPADGRDKIESAGRVAQLPSIDPSGEQASDSQAASNRGGIDPMSQSVGTSVASPVVPPADAGAARMNTVSGKRVERPPCEHDSTRIDGWLDTHCLRCGADSYWRNGVRFAEVDIHPSGKVLVRPVVGPVSGGDREALTQALDKLMMVGAGYRARPIPLVDAERIDEARSILRSILLEMPGDSEQPADRTEDR